jgi:hypothetical protein
MRFIALTCLAACAGPDDDGESADTGVAPEPYEPTWAGMERLFADNCDRCHPSQNGIDLRTVAQHTTTPVTTYLPWVTPGDPDQSWMWVMVSGQAGLTIMPADGLLPLETVDPMRVWIENGAPFE